MAQQIPPGSSAARVSVSGCAALIGLMLVLSVSGVVAQPTCPVQNLPNVVAPGVVVQGSLDPADCSALPYRNSVVELYTFVASAGDRLVIRMTRGTLSDAYLYLLNDAGTAVAFDDDSAGSLNPLIEYTASSSSVYTVVATSYSQGDYGSYSLSVSRSGAGVPPAPTNLRTSVSNRDATLAWDPAPGATNYTLQAGTISGQYTLYNAPVGNTTSVVGRSLANGVYFWRLIASNAAGSGAPSVETSFTVGGVTPGCAPAPPQNFTFTINGARVTLRWAAPSGGGSPTTYIVEAGSSTGIANLYNAATGSAATEVSADVPNGTYFVRIRSQNACGSSSPSNEQQIVVGPTSGCSYSVSPTSEVIASGGGTLRVQIVTGNQCTWEASTRDSWIRPASATSGTGSATVQFNVDPNRTSARSGRVTVLGTSANSDFAQDTTVSQPSESTSATCTYTASPVSQTIPSGGGVLQVQITASSSQCTWQASAADSWIRSASATSGAGSATLLFNIDPNSSSARTSRVTVLGTSVSPAFTSVTTVSQTADASPASCTYSVSPPSRTIPSAGGVLQVQITASRSQCTWQASAADAWIQPASATSGAGSATVQFNVDRNSSPARTGRVTVIGTGVSPSFQYATTVSQETGAVVPTPCNYTASSPSASVVAGGGSYQVQVTASQPTCSWRASGDAPWLTLVSGQSGTGSGTVRFDVDRNFNAARNATVSVVGTTASANATVALSQAAETTCSYGLAPQSLSAPAAGGNYELGVSTTSDCVWFASADQSWITVFNAAGAAGNGAVRYGVAANTGSSRSGSISVVGPGGTVRLAVSQQPGSQPLVARFAVLSSGGSEVGASAGSACTAVRSTSTTITLRCTLDARLSGPAEDIVSYSWNIGGLAASGPVIEPTVSSSVDAGSFTATLTVRNRNGLVASQTQVVYFRVAIVTTASPTCALAFAPSQTVPAAGGVFELPINTFFNCAPWVPRVFPPASSWIALISPSSSNGDGVLRYRIAPNTGSARSEVIRIFVGTRQYEFRVSQSGG